jgi:hypothetical protein
MRDDFAELPDYIRELIASGEPIDEIRIDSEGNWTHNGDPFLNERIISFFNKSVDVTADGVYVISYGDFVYPITVDDTPVFVTGVRFEGFGDFEKVHITLTTGDEEDLDIDTLHHRANNCLYCRVRNGRLIAKFKRSPSFQILDRLDESDDIFYLNICGRKIVLRRK